MDEPGPGYAGNESGNGASAAVRAELDQLRATVQEQQRVLEAQQATMKEMAALVRGAAAAPAPAATLSPFEAQLLASSDRRGMGQFDARFHSTSA